MASLAIILVVAATVAAVSIYGSQTTQGSSSTTAPCVFPAYITKLASQVEATQAFTSQSHGLNYALAYGYNESAETGQAGGKSLAYPPDTSLAFYSYGTNQTQVCPQAQRTSGVVGALWVSVPIGPDGSYALANESVYFTPGVFTNETIGGLSVGLVQLLYLVGPIPPFNPGGPVVSITLNNSGRLPIISLTASIRFNASGTFTRPYVFNFDVNSSAPLFPGHYITASETLIGAGFQGYTNYPLTINATTLDGYEHQLTLEAQVAPLSYMEPNSLGSFCQGPTGYDACFGASFGQAVAFNCAIAASTQLGCTMRVSNSSAPQYAYTVTVWYPYYHIEGLPFPNCRYTSSGDQGEYYYADCISINSTAFVVAIESPPPT